MALAEPKTLLANPGRALPWFRGLTLATAISAFALVILGGVVRVTESGLGCPDWPLCHGGIFPPLETKAIVEYSHRIVASLLVGPLILATVIIAWVAYRRVPWVVVPATVALVLLVTQALLGGSTVLNELPGAVVSAHLAVGEVLLACLILLAVVAFRGPLVTTLSRSIGGRKDRFPLLILAAAVGVYALLMSGSYVTITGATFACAEWPLCQGELFPENRLPNIHMGHRFLVAIVGLFVLFTLIRGSRKGRWPKHIRMTSMAVGALFIAQVMIGAGTIWLTFPQEFRALHLGAGTAVWGSITLLTLLIFTPSPSSGAYSSSGQANEEPAHA
ncbi:MAG: hypothetical protein BZY81_03305 [SAR202 cluster bacterium Io17-Chloro-G4]|nr:MAG: hypothetical protein BZY81_03305 [SAR202 cluster bacterium Io17-Chloro-G4]